MILETLGLRPRTPQSPAERSQENLSSSEGVSSMRQSIRSSNTASSLSPSLSSSPSGRSKRYSNNLFGSGRLRDYSYNRMRAQSKRDTSSVATVESQTLSISQNSSLFQEGTVTPSRSSGTPPTSQEEPSAEYQMSKSVASSVFKRASLALEEAIRELEEDAEDEIVMPRSAPITRTSLDQHHTVCNL
jgi:serine/arginine repetitive matrix protein 2